MLQTPITTIQNGTNIEVRRYNRARIFRYLLNCEKTSQSELASKLDISWPTVQQNIKELSRQGLVQELGLFASTGGRKAMAVALVPEARNSIGIDITQNHIGFVLLDLYGSIIARDRIAVPFTNSSNWFQKLSSLTNHFLEDNKVDSDRLLGLGVALPTVISPNKGPIPSPNALGAIGLSLSQFESVLPTRTMFINDADAAGFAEFSSGDSLNNAIYLSLNNSVGGSLLLNGRLYQGETQRSGEFGHITVIPNGRPCYCGSHGCLETYCSAKELTQHSEGDLAEFFKRLNNNDPKIISVWNGYLDILLLAINNIRMSLDCPVILGGYVGAQMQDYQAEIRQKLIKQNPFRPDVDYLRFCHYRQEASAVGAGLLWIEQFINSL